MAPSTAAITQEAETALPRKWFASDDRWQVGPHTRQLTRVKKLELVGPLLKKSLSPERTSGIIQVSPVPVHTSGQLGELDHAILPSTSARFAIAAECPVQLISGREGLKQGKELNFTAG